MIVCEGELEIASDSLDEFLKHFSGHVSLFLIDDGSPSNVGKQIVDRFAHQIRNPIHFHRISTSLKFRGMAKRLSLAFDLIANSGKEFDLVVRLDSDALLVRDDLERVMRDFCHDDYGLFGETLDIRGRDKILFLADLIPFGFKRKTVDGVMERQWQLSRFYPVWWWDFGWKSILQGFRFQVILGSFWFMGWKTFEALREKGYLSRSQSHHGFIFCDDVLLTAAVHALDHSVVNLGDHSIHWKDTLTYSQDSPLSVIQANDPYVVHPLKNNPKAWNLRKNLSSPHA